MFWFKRLAFAALFWPAPLWAEGLVIFAAASLKEPLDQIVADWPGARVTYAGSGTLARQVQQGAPADVVLLANAAWMDVLRRADAVEAPAPFIANTLVLIGQPGADEVALTEAGLTRALDGGRLAMGFPTSVPAGIYGQQAFESLGLWQMIEAQVAQVDNVRAALALALRAEVPLAVVYASDARHAPGLPIVARFPAGSHDPIAYWAAAVAGSDNADAPAFVARLAGPKAQAILTEAGFCPLAACGAE